MENTHTPVTTVATSPPSFHYIVDRVLHWLSALGLLFMLLNMSAQLHTVDWQIKGQVAHKQDAIEVHALVGSLLLLVLLAREIWYRAYAPHIPRQQVANPVHRRVIQLVHVMLPITIAALAITGLLMTTEADMPLSLWGMTLTDGATGMAGAYSSLHNWHLRLIELMWWLIGLHFIGVLYARR